MELILAVVAAAIVGSALSALGESPRLSLWALRARSACPQCARAVAVRDLVPVLSFVILRGKCRSCGKPIPRWHLVVELVTLIVFLLPVVVRPGVSVAELVVLWVFFGLLVALATIDLRHLILPDVLVGAVAVAGLLRSVLLGSPGFARSILGGLLGFLALGLISVLPWPGARSSPGEERSTLVPGAGAAMGFGDVKLAGALGLVLGPLGVAATLFLAFVAGGAVGAVLLMAGRATLKTRVPFGPFLAGAAVFLLLFPTATDAFSAAIGFPVE